LSALEALYGRMARLRRAWYTNRPHRRRQLQRPVVSVGNLVVGGSGKTPVVAALARMLLDMGERPAVLSRGYGRRRSADGVVVVSDGSRVLEPVESSGDEPHMLARALRGVPVLVSPDRYLAGRLAEKHFGCTVLLLDDGYQHVQLDRDLDLLLVAPGDLAERVLPWGPLREPLDAAHGADALLVPASLEEAGRVATALGVRRVFGVTIQYDPPRPLDPRGETPSSIAGRRLVAVAAIARPRRFFDAVRARGGDLVHELEFPDHHWFTAADVERASRVARDAHAEFIVTTEKDAVRLDGIGSDVPWVALPMSVVIEPRALFEEWLRGRLTAARARGARA
jgi:tetraacyldisaccharide 4'-kinase